MDRNPDDALFSQFTEKRRREIAAHLSDRRCEALTLYTPMPFQEQFHKETAQQVVLQKGNRAGGSTAGFIEVARAVTGQDPYDKYPKENGKAVCLGYGEKHIGRVIYQYLFRPGAFKMIRDKETKKWRVYRPWPESEGGDLEREKEAKPAPPLIPQRFIKPGTLAWEKKSEKVFSQVEFTTGWTLYAANSAGDPGQFQGMNIDLYHIDEDLATSGWYEEALGRVAACNGKLRWTALPHARNDELLSVIDQAEKQAEKPDAQVKVIRASIFDNKYISQKSVASIVESWKAQGDDVMRKRALGELVIDSIRMYPTFSRRIHSAARFEEPRHEVQKILVEREGQPPEDWCRYTMTDPGHTVAATLFAATPPPELGDFVVVYDEIYIRGATAETWGDAFEERVKGHTFHAFGIDEHGAALAELATGISPRERYRAQLQKRNLKCEVCGDNFISGCDGVKSREEALRNWLAIRREGYPTLLIVVGRCPNLCWEIERFKKKTVQVGGQSVPTDDGNRKLNTHAVECLEMLAAHGCEYVKPAYRAITYNHAEAVISARKKREMQRVSLFGASHYIPLTPAGI